MGGDQWQCGHWRPVTSPPCCSEWKSIFNWLDYYGAEASLLCSAEGFFQPWLCGCHPCGKAESVKEWEDSAATRSGSKTNPPLLSHCRGQGGSQQRPKVEGFLRKGIRATNLKHEKLKVLTNNLSSSVCVYIFFHFLGFFSSDIMRTYLWATRQLPEGWVKWEERGGSIT